MTSEKGTFDTESGLILRVPGKIFEAIGNIAIATKFIATETYRDLMPTENTEPTVQF